MLAVAAALATIVTTPLVLFPIARESGPAAPAPSATGEVTRVTAPALPEGKETSAPPASAPTVLPPTPTSAPVSSTSGALGPAAESDSASDSPTGDAGTGDREPAANDAGGGTPTTKRHGAVITHHGKAKGHDKTQAHGKAKGHDKAKAHGNAKGHDKPDPPSGIALDPPHGQKPHHPHPPGAGKHPGRSARAHARAGR